MEKTVGLVGLGSMGAGMAGTLLGKGFAVVGHDVSEGRRGAVPGIEAVAEVAAVFARARTVVLSLPGAAEVEAVVQASGLFAAPAERTIVVDTTTSEPDASRRLAAALRQAGHGFLDAPVSGGPQGAASGRLAMMIGGAEEDLAFARPAIDALAATVMHVGPSGAGNVAKLVNNLLVAAHMITTREGLRLAAAAGVDPEAVLTVVNAATGRSALSEIHFPTWIASGRFDSGFTMGLMRKDVRLALGLAERAGADLPLSREAGRLWAEHPAADPDDFTRMGAWERDDA
jgi:3-hydroxyisobutyrate dehydrogenase